MSVKLFLVVITFLLLKDVNLEETDTYNKIPFTSVVSTTQNPYNDRQKFEEMQTTLKEYKHRTEILELQNTRLQMRVEDLLKAQEKPKPCETSNQLSEEHTRIMEELRKIEERKFNESQNLLESIKQILLELNKTKELLSQETRRNQTKFEDLPTDCKQVLGTTGVYKIKPKNAPMPFDVFCDMDIREGGWIYVLNRFDGSENFQLNWTDYRNGFGDLKREFWLGLEHLYMLTGLTKSELLFELEDWEGKVVHAHYNYFSIGNEKESYPLNVLSGYSGDAGDHFMYHIGKKFSTLDHKDPNTNQKYLIGGWWYHNTFHVRLTGRYEPKNIDAQQASGIHWGSFHSYNYSLKKVKMMIRPWN